MACGGGGGCCSSAGRLNADNARFLLLAVLIVLYMLCGAAVFSAIELPTERQAKERWEERLENFTQRHNLSRAELRHFLREYEEATVAGIRVDDIRPRWDFTGAFYFVGTVVSTIGECPDSTGSRGGGAAVVAVPAVEGSPRAVLASPGGRGSLGMRGQGQTPGITAHTRSRKVLKSRHGIPNVAASYWSESAVRSWGGSVGSEL